MKTLLLTIVTITCLSCAAIREAEHKHHQLYVHTKALRVDSVSRDRMWLSSFSNAQRYRMHMYDHGYSKGDTLWLRAEDYGSVKFIR